MNPEIRELYNLIRRHKHTGVETEKLNDGFDRVQVSFETGEQTTLNCYVPFSQRIKRIRGRTIKAMAGTDDGAVTVKNAAGSTMATLTFAASTAIDTDVTAQVPSANNLIGKDSFYQLVVAKTTAGGKALVTVEYERL